MSTLLSSLLFGSGTSGATTGTFSASGIFATVEIAPATDLLDVPTAWTDITPWVRRMSTRRGRNHELGKTSAGVATITLDNRDRRFDSTYTSSPYYPDLVPMTHVRIIATYLSVTYPMFYGFVEDWGQSWPQPAANAQGDAVVEVQAVDAFKVFNLLQITSYPSVVDEDDPFVYYRLAEGAAGIALDDGGDDHHGQYVNDTGPFVFGSGPLFNSGEVPNLSLGHIELPDTVFDNVADKSLTVEAWIRLDTLASTGRIVFGDDVLGLVWNSTVGLRFSYNSLNPSDNPVVDSGLILAANTWYHVVAVRDWDTGFLRLYVNGAEVAATPFGRWATAPIRTDYWIGSSGAFPFPGRVAHVAAYSKVLTPARIAAHYASGIDQATSRSGEAIAAVLDTVGWPAGARDLDTGVVDVTITPDGSALDVLSEVAEDSESGILFMAADNDLTFIDRAALQALRASVATFGDGAGEVDYADLEFSYDDQDLWTEVSASGAEASAVLVRNDAAVTRYGTRTLTVSGVASTANEVADIANGLLARYKAPALRPVKLTVNKSAIQQLSRLIGERVTIKRRPPGGGTMTTDAIIEGIDHDVTTDGFIATTFSLVPATTEIPWLLADATYGILGSTTDLGW